jgi:hypothetical protein
MNRYLLNRGTAIASVLFAAFAFVSYPAHASLPSKSGALPVQLAPQSIVAQATTPSPVRQTTTTTAVPLGSKSIDAVVVFDTDSLVSVGQKCEATGICGRVGIGKLDFTGSLKGSATYMMSMTIDPLVPINRSSAGTINASDLVVDGCGRGSFQASFSSSYAKRGANGLFGAHWEIVPFSRGGDFSGRLEGEGTLVSEAPLSATASVIRMTGEVRC